MADVTPKTWKSAAGWLVATVVVLAVFAWWSGVFQTPPEPSPEARQEMDLDSDEADQVAPPATQPPVESNDQAQQPY